MRDGEERQRAQMRHLIARIKPFRQWIREKPRTPRQVEMYWQLLKQAAALVARPEPNTARLVDGKWVLEFS